MKRWAMSQAFGSKEAHGISKGGYVIAMRCEIKNRLYNWKFKAALKLIDEDKGKSFPRVSRDVVKALADTFGDSGWMDENSSMGEIVQVVVNKLTDTPSILKR